MNKPRSFQNPESNLDPCESGVDNNQITLTVWATPTTSLPFKANGIALDWIGVGLVKPASCRQRLIEEHIGIEFQLGNSPPAGGMNQLLLHGPLTLTIKAITEDV